MKTFNLSRWALAHKSFVVYLMLVVALAGIFEYRQLGRDEDPPFTIKTMVVKTLWPGATTLEMMQQVTDRIEKKLEELPNIDYQKSYTKPGESVVFVYLKDSTRASDVPDLWYQVRKKIGDAKQTLPQGVQGPFFNDEFGDTYALILVGATIALFVAALAGMQFVQQQFFPSSDRPELLVDLTLPQGSSINATRKVVDDLEKILKTDPDIEHWSFYIGSGAIRFYLPLDQQLANDFFAQGVIVTKGFKIRPAVQARILAALQRPEFEQVQPRVSPLELGPPVGWPLKFRISGPDPTKVRELAHEFASVLGKTPNARNINFDWNEPSKVVRVEVDQDRARALGISSQTLSQTINAVLSGTTITELRDDIYLIDIVARAIPDERAKLETLRSLIINVSGGRSVPLEQLAKLSYAIEPPLIWRRHRLPTITVQADTAPGLEAATVVKALSTDLTAFNSNLPAGYDVVVGGTVEDSAKAEASIFAVFPLMILLMTTILMVQLQSFQRLFLAVATAPLALIGVAGALLISRSPMGFVAILGVVSLIGMVIRNSVILIDQIDHEVNAGVHPWNAVIVATEHRLRPILLTAAAAILGMIPIAPTVFWGPMAYAVMGGLVVATLLTLVFLPALYVAWFRITPLASPEAEGSIAQPALAHA